MYTMGEGNEDTATISMITTRLQSNLDVKPMICLRALLVLFNLTQSFAIKFDLLQCKLCLSRKNHMRSHPHHSIYLCTPAILDYSMATRLSASVAHLAPQIEPWLTQWKASVTQKRSTLQKMAKILEMTGDSSQALHILIKFFNTYKDTAYSKDTEGLIIQALVNAINSPIHDFNDRAALQEVLGPLIYSCLLSNL